MSQSLSPLLRGDVERSETGGSSLTRGDVERSETGGSSLTRGDVRRGKAILACIIVVITHEFNPSS